MLGDTNVEPAREQAGLIKQRFKTRAVEGGAVTMFIIEQSRAIVEALLVSSSACFVVGDWAADRNVHSSRMRCSFTMEMLFTNVTRKRSQ